MAATAKAIETGVMTASLQDGTWTWIIGVNVYNLGGSYPAVFDTNATISGGTGAAPTPIGDSARATAIRAYANTLEGATNTVPLLGVSVVGRNDLPIV